MLFLRLYMYMYTCINKYMYMVTNTQCGSSIIKSAVESPDKLHYSGVNIYKLFTSVYMGAYPLIVFYIDITYTRTSMKTGYLSWWNSSISQIKIVPIYLSYSHAGDWLGSIWSVRQQ